MLHARTGPCAATPRLRSPLQRPVAGPRSGGVFRSWPRGRGGGPGMTPNPADEGTGAAPAPGAAPTLPSPSPSSPAVAWREIGRGERGTRAGSRGSASRTTGGRGDAFYRSMVVADDAIEVAVEREPPYRRRGAAARAPRPVRPAAGRRRGIEERAAPLLAAADKAAARVAARTDASRA